MKKNKEKKEKIKISKGELVIKIMATILVVLMLLSVCGTSVYYILSNV